MSGRRRLPKLLGCLLAAALALGAQAPASAQTRTETRALTPVPAAAAAPAPPEAPFLRVDADFHTQVVNRFAQDRDGRIIVTGSDDKTIRTWQASDGAPLATLRVPIADGDEGAIYAVAVSPDGRTLLAGGYTGATWDHAFAVYIFDLETGRMRGRLPNLPAPINHLAFAPDGSRFAIAMGGTAGIRVIDATDGHLIAADDQYRERATWIEFDASGRLFAASYDGEVRLYDATGRRLAHRAPVPGGHPYGLAVSPDGRSVAVGYADRPRVELLNAQDLGPRASLTNGPGGRETGAGGLGAVAWGRDGSLYAAGSLRGAAQGSAAGATVVRHWVGTAAPTDQAGLADTIFQIGATADGGVLMVGAGPGMARLDRAGRPVFRKTSPGLDFRDMADQRFLVSTDGQAVQLQTKAMAQPWVVDLGQRSVHPLQATRALVPVPAPAPGPAAQVTNWRNAASPRIDGQPIRLEPEEQSRSFAVTPAQDLVAIGTDYQLRIFRRDGQPTDSAALPGAAWAVGISGDGRSVVAAVGDGTLRWFGLDAAGRLEPRVSLFLAADGRRWVAWTQGGLFDHADLGGKELVGLLLNKARGQVPEWFSFAQVYRLFYRPDAVAQQLRGQPVTAAAASVGDLRRLLANAPPPAIELNAVCWADAGQDVCRSLLASNTARGLRVEAAPGAPGAEAVDALLPAGVQTIRLRYRLVGEGGGRSAVDVFVNERNGGRVQQDVRRAGEAFSEQLAPVDPGPNQIQLRAYDGAVQTYAQSRVIRLGRATALAAAATASERGASAAKPAPPAAPPPPAAQAKPTLFVMAVGIDHYPPGINSLNFAVADARAVAAAIKAHAPDSYGAVKMTELYDQAASATNVMQAFKTIGAEATSRDTVLVYLSGHGATIGNTYYFITQNVSSVDRVPQSAISDQALVQGLSEIRAVNGMMFLDTCHAGAFSLDSVGQIAHETGRYMLAASASVEEALDSYDDHNGVFATAVLRGLAGGAPAAANGDVDNFALGFYVTPLVHQLASERLHNQSARFRIAAEDAKPFPVAEVRK